MADRGSPLLVHAPQENVSDDSYLLLEWSFADGENVEEGDVLGEFETSKNVFELPAPTSGVFYAFAEAGQHVAVNGVVAVIAPGPLTSAELAEVTSTTSDATAESDTATQVGHATPIGGAEDQGSPASSAVTPEPAGQEHPGVRFSRAAEEAIAANAVDRALFTSPGLVRLADVERVLSGAGDADALTPTATPRVRVLGSSVVIVGAGGHSRTLIDLLAELRSFRIVGILDGGVPAGHTIGGYPVLGPDTDEELARLHARGLRLAVNGVGGITKRDARPRVWAKLQAAGFGLPNLVHPNAIVDASACLGEGVQVLAGAYVGAGVSVGDNCIVNTGSVLSHDCAIADHAHVAPGAVLAGNVTVGYNSLVGMGTSVYLGVSIGSDVIVTNGVSLFTNVPDGTVVRSSDS